MHLPPTLAIHHATHALSLCLSLSAALVVAFLFLATRAIGHCIEPRHPADPGRGRAGNATVVGAGSAAQWSQITKHLHTTAPGRGHVDSVECTLHATVVGRKCFTMVADHRCAADP